MKRWLFISGIIIIIVLFAIWVYLLLNPASNPRDLFNSFGFTGEEEGVGELEQDFTLPELEAERERLRQLTTRQVAGYEEVVTASSTVSVYIIEAGTGHVFSIDPLTGNETRISNITVRNTVAGSISRDGVTAAVISRIGRNQTLTTIDLSSLEETAHNESVLQASFTSNSDAILYTTQTGSRVLAKTLNLKTREARDLFSLPFNEVVVMWGDEESGPHYFYPKTARFLEGYLYSMSSSTMKREPVSGFGLSVVAKDSIIFFSRGNEQGYASQYLNASSSELEVVDGSFFPEKCAFTSINNLICGKPSLSFGSDFPDEWYRGEVRFSDSLWLIDTSSNRTTSLLNTLSISGREIDSFNFKVVTGDASVYFMNKNDSSLWVYDI